VRAIGLNLRSGALFAVGALGVHDLRVVAGYGRDAEFVLREPGHAYLPFATGVAVALLVVAGFRFARAVTRPSFGQAAPVAPAGLVSRWLTSSVLLAVTYLAQASAESFFDPGHPVLGHGGWSVAPLALAVGLVIAVVTREADHAMLGGSTRGVTWQVRLTGVALIARAPWCALRRAPLASQAAGRAPPLLA
jgi:hypothetical protein